MSSSTRAKRVVRAAGALVWRECRGRLEVLLVHRPRYDDWSFPKGKVERNESVRTCAVREVAEETGVRIALGQPLETVRYKMSDGRRKRVYYWAARELGADEPGARARAAVTPASAREIDGVAWVRVKKARKQLTHAMDRDLLGSLVDLWEDGKLDTWTFVLVRHARAVKRSVWSRHRPKRVRDKEADEATRPLTHDQGEVRARALVPVLAAYGVGRVVSSPWRRCVDTVAPYAVALCTHRPVLPSVMEVISRHAPGKLLRSVPDRDPWLKTGEIMVVHLARRPRGRIRAVAIEKQRPVLSEGR